MRSARISFKGAYQHITSRAYNGIDIFKETKYKNYLLSLVLRGAELYRIDVIGYCIMDNHCHLIIKEQSGRMGEFMRFVNGNFGAFYRKMEGGKGYVFQDRYHSKLIQDDPNMIMVVMYVLLNPVKANILKNPFKYKWSSINIYYSNDKSISSRFVENYFTNKNQFRKRIQSSLKEISDFEFPVITTPLGDFIGNPANIRSIINRYNRRKLNDQDKKSMMRKRKEEYENVKNIIHKFEKQNKVKMNKINVHTHKGKRLRGQLLVLLKEKVGLTYKEITKIELFKNIKFSSLGSIYQHYRNKKCTKKIQKSKLRPRKKTLEKKR